MRPCCEFLQSLSKQTWYTWHNCSSSQTHLTFTLPWSPASFRANFSHPGPMYVTASARTLIVGMSSIAPEMEVTRRTVSIASSAVGGDKFEFILLFLFDLRESFSMSFSLSRSCAIIVSALNGGADVVRSILPSLCYRQCVAASIGSGSLVIIAWGALPLSIRTSMTCDPIHKPRPLGMQSTLSDMHSLHREWV